MFHDAPILAPAEAAAAYALARRRLSPEPPVLPEPPKYETWQTIVFNLAAGQQLFTSDILCGGRTATRYIGHVRTKAIRECFLAGYERLELVVIFKMGKTAIDAALVHLSSFDPARKIRED